MQQRAAAAGAPVPHILVADNSPAALGNPYLICDAIGGETIVRRIQRSLDDAGRERLLQQCAQALAAIHRADPDGHRPDRGRSARRVARPPRRDGRHHGDLRVGVSLAGRSPATAVAAGSGARRFPDGQPDRRRPPGWPPSWTGNWCTSARSTRTWPGSASGPGGSARPRRSAQADWAASRAFCPPTSRPAGTTVDRDAFRWWLTVATLRWGVICRFQAERHLSGQTPSVELAAIGRRVSETEWDVLDLLEGGGPK